MAHISTFVSNSRVISVICLSDDLVEPDSDDESARPAAAAAAAPVSTSATASSFGAVGWASAVLQPGYINFFSLSSTEKFRLYAETTACASSQDAVYLTLLHFPCM